MSKQRHLQVLQCHNCASAFDRATDDILRTSVEAKVAGPQELRLPHPTLDTRVTTLLKVQPSYQEKQLVRV